MTDKLEHLYEYLKELIPETFMDPPKMVMENNIIIIEEHLGIVLENLEVSVIDIIEERKEITPTLLLYGYKHIPQTRDEPGDIDEHIMECTTGVGTMLVHVMKAIGHIMADDFLDKKMAEALAEDYEEEKEYEV